MDFLNQFNKKETIKNTKAMLKEYAYYHQLSKKIAMPAIHSVTINDMPKAPHNSNGNEDRMIDYLTRQEFAQNYCKLIEATSDALEDDTSRFIIQESYINNRYTNGYLVDKVGFSEVRYYQLKNKALFEFATICYGKPVMNDSGKIKYEPLLVMNKQSC